jgi:hypothetical protein
LPRASFASLLVGMSKGGKSLGTATGFIVERDAKRYLVTNRHVVRGEQPNALPKLPTELTVMQHVAGQLGQWSLRTESLYDKGEPRWYEHAVQPLGIDVAVLPLSNDAGIDVYGYDPWDSNRMLSVQLSEPLNIIGFPFGVTSGGALGIWVRGFIATEIALDWNGLPRFLVDSRTRSGQSGSPVIAYSPAGAATHVATGGLATLDHDVEEFFGVYSGRINEQSDLGIVWKKHLICDIVDGKKQAIL